MLASFFARLEHQDHPTGQFRPPVLKQPGCAEQHRDVGVVAARVHRPVDLGGEVQTGVLVERQRVHVAPKEDRRPGSTALDHRDHGAQRLALAGFDPDPRELVDDDLLRLGQLEADLGMPMDPPPDRDDGRLDRARGVEQIVRGVRGTGCRIGRHRARIDRLPVVRRRAARAFPGARLRSPPRR